MGCQGLGGERERMKWQNGEEKWIKPLSQLAHPTPLHQQWTDPAGRKPVRTMVNSSIHQLGGMDINRLGHPMTTEHTFYSTSQEAVTRTDAMLGHETHTKRF